MDCCPIMFPAIRFSNSKGFFFEKVKSNINKNRVSVTQFSFKGRLRNVHQNVYSKTQTRTFFLRYSLMNFKKQRFCFIAHYFNDV